MIQRRTSTISPPLPYSFNLTLERLSSFQRHIQVDLFSNGKYHRLFNINGIMLLATVYSIGTIEGPKLHVMIEGTQVSESDTTTILKMLKHTLSAPVSLHQFYNQVSQDKALSSIIEKLYALHPAKTPTIFEALVQAIIGQ
ncbi:hypothetical protein FIM12_01430 [SAR202 cluster bacterium AD-804-J14_MRT_500m]|nr:hypothetical protein [SAR202 cluster bacterium AD-804-J14_MRT_500m]